MNLSEWGEVAKIVGGVGGVSTGVIAILGYRLARSGVNAWKRQLTGQNRYDVAKRTLYQVLTVRNELQRVRSPFSSSGEIEAALRAAGHEVSAETISSPEAAYHTHRARLAPLYEGMTKLEAVVVEAEVLLGAEVRKAFWRMIEVVNEVDAAMDHDVHVRRERLSGRRTPEQHEFDQRMTRIRCATTGNDETREKVDAIVETFSRLLRPHLVDEAK